MVDLLAARDPENPAAALAFEPHEGLAPVAVREDTGAAAEKARKEAPAKKAARKS